jgi:hypothetical protein
MVTPLSINNCTKFLEETAVFGVGAGPHANPKDSFDRLTRDITIHQENRTLHFQELAASLNTALQNLAYYPALPLPLGLTNASSRTL